MPILFLFPHITTVKIKQMNKITKMKNYQRVIQIYLHKRYYVEHICKIYFVRLQKNL